MVGHALQVVRTEVRRKALKMDGVLSRTAAARPAQIMATDRTGTSAVAAMFAVSWGAFLLASGRGFEFNDESYYLIAISASNNYPSVLSEFGRIWHPLYELTNGNLTLFRIAGALVLLACGTMFGFSVLHFIGARIEKGSLRACVLMAILTTLLLQFDAWKPTPNYNVLNCCGLLLFCSGLLFAGKSSPGDATRRMAALALLGAPALTGAGLAVVALNKPTSGVLSLCLALAWLIFVRPPRRSIRILVAACSGTFVLGIFVLAAYGSLDGFIHGKLFAAQFEGGVETSGGAFNGTVGSVTTILAYEKLWKFIPGTIYSLGIALLAAGFFAAMLSRPKRRWVMSATTLAIALAVLVAIFRVEDSPGASYGYLAWALAPVLVLAAFVAVAFAERLPDVRSQEAFSSICAALILALMPIAFSVGTTAVLIFHVGGAGVFWLAASVIFGGVFHAGLRARAIGSAAILFSDATVGTLLGIMIAPHGGHYPLTPEYPIWRQTYAVSLGPDQARVLVDRDSAEQIRALQEAAKKTGFGRNSPILDLSEFQPSGAFILSGRTPGQILPYFEDTGYARRLIGTASRSDLRRSWLITGAGKELARAESILRADELDFPASYDRVAEIRRGDNGLSQILWKPRSPG